MFIGEYSHTIDEKGRIAIPIKFRADLSNGAVVTKGFDNCLDLYTMEEWRKKAEKISDLPVKARALQRQTLAAAMDVKIDKQGRVILPDYLRKYAGIDKKTIIAGLYSHLEIWDEDKWKKYKEDTEKFSGDIAETLGELGV